MRRLMTHRRFGCSDLRAVACAALLLAGVAAYADVYKWIDAEGRVHFTDRPPPSDGRLVSIGQTARTVTQSSAEAPEAPTPVAAGPSAAAPPKPEASLIETVFETLACQTARERYQQYVSARRLYLSGEQNDRQYLSDAEMEAARIQARHDVEELCGQAP